MNGKLRGQTPALAYESEKTCKKGLNRELGSVKTVSAAALRSVVKQNQSDIIIQELKAAKSIRDSQRLQPPLAGDHIARPHGKAQRDRLSRRFKWSTQLNLLNKSLCVTAERGGGSELRGEFREIA